MQVSMEEYARERIHIGCLVQIENSVTWDNCSASVGMPHDANSYPVDGIFNLHLTTIIPVDSYSLNAVFHLMVFHQLKTI